MKMKLFNRSTPFKSCLSTQSHDAPLFSARTNSGSISDFPPKPGTLSSRQFLAQLPGAGDFSLIWAEVRKFSLSQTMTNSGSLPSRRNLPRASHACQRCRAKKAKCDQQQPCANCVRHEWDCVYGLRRKNARASTVSVLNDVQRNTPPSPLSSSRSYYDEAARGSEPIEQAHSTGRIGMVIILVLDASD